MIVIVARHDWRNLCADRTVQAVTLLFAAIVAYGIYNGASWVRFQEDTIRAALGEEHNRLQGLKQGITEANEGLTQPSAWRDPRSPFAAGHALGSRYTFMPPGPLALLAVGQSDLYPYYYKVSLKSRDALAGNDEIENPIHLLSGRFDLAFVILYLYPLVILTLSYNLISSERENGTLAITLAQPVRLLDVALGKMASRGLFIVLLATVLPVAGMWVANGQLVAGGAAPHLATWALLVAIYGAFWFALAILVNGFGRSSASNALSLAGTWLTLVLLVPSLLNVAVKAAHPVPPRVELIQATRVASDEVTAQRSRLMARYMEDHPELAGASGDTMAQLAIRNVAMSDEIDRRVEPVLRKFDEMLIRQQQLVDRYCFLSPAILTQAVLYDLAGTSSGRHAHFVRLTADFHREWKEFFQPLMLQAVELETADIDRLPRFIFREEPGAAVLQRVTRNLTGLAIATALASGLALVSLSRYPLAG